MEHDKNEERFKTVEKKLSLLITLAIAQSAALAILIIMVVFQQFMPGTMTLFLFLVGVVAFLYVFRKQVPGWIGNMSRYAFSQMFAAQKSDSMKDIK